MIFEFPNVIPEKIVPYLDETIQAIKDLKRKKKPFIVTYSKDGLELKSE